MPNKLVASENVSHHVLLLFYPFGDNKELPSGFPSLCQNKLGQKGVWAVVIINKIKFELYGDLVDQAFSQFYEKSITNQDPHSQFENDETPGAEYLNENYSEDTEKNKTSAISNFMTKMLTDDEITESINYLNLKQREVFNVVHKWAAYYVKYNGHGVEPVYIFFPGSVGIGKSHLVKVIHNAISKTLLYHCKDPEKPRDLLLGPTDI